MFIPLLFILQTIAIPTESEAKESLRWHAQCTSNRDKCWLEKLVDFSGPQNVEKGGVAVAYDNVEHKPMYVTVLVPPDADKEAGVTVHFLYTVKKGESWSLKSAPTGMMSLPIMDCDKQFCAARVDPHIDNGNGTYTDFFAELKKNNHLWVLFIRNKKPERFMVPVSGIVDAIEQVSQEKSIPVPPPQQLQEGKVDH